MEREGSPSLPILLIKFFILASFNTAPIKEVSGGKECRASQQRVS